MIKRTLLFIDFGSVFILVSLNISDIELEEDSDTDKSENFNVGIQTYLIFEEEHEEFIVIKVNLNIVKRDNEEYLYNEDNLYLEFNNVGYDSIIQMNYIYDYYVFYLRPKAIYNFFFKIMFRLIKKTYREEETRHWIFTIKTMIYRIFISLFEYLPIYIKKRIMLEEYREPFYLKYYLEKAKE